MSGGGPRIAALEPGQRLGELEIVRQLAAEGQAHVYLARVWGERNPPLAALLRRMRWLGATPALVAAQGLCVVKLAMPGWVENLRDEHAYLLDAALSHPRLARLFETEETTGGRRRMPRGLRFATFADAAGRTFDLPYLVLHYEPGGSLRQLLDAHGRRPLPAPAAVAIALQVADALLWLHTRAGLVHHDVSPSNVLFRQPLSALRARRPDCVLIDLAVADSPRRPRLRRTYGKRLYLPPERLALPPAPIDPAIDVYGLGVVLYEMLAGRLPEALADGAPLPPIGERRGGLSPELAALVTAAVNYDPRRRPTLPALVEALGRTPEARRAAGLRGAWDLRATWQAAAGAIGVLAVASLAWLPSALAAPARPEQAPPTPAPVATVAPKPPPTLAPTSTAAPAPTRRP